MTKTGTGASGTWGISITGNAATATSATSATYSFYPKITFTNEIRFDAGTKLASAGKLYVGYKWSDGSSDAKINRYAFYNGGAALAEVEASTFYGALSGNATTATSATNDSAGNNISTTYVKKDGDTMTGTLILSKATDLSGSANNKPALIVGGTDTQAHIEMDANEI